MALHCTVIIPPQIIFFTNELFKILVAHNRLNGEHDQAKLSGKDVRGFRRMLMGMDDQFADGMRSLGGIVGIVGYSVKCYIENAHNK